MKAIEFDGVASGLLTGKLRTDSAFAHDDHRSFNRHGEAFDVGETFAGVDYATGLAAVDQLRQLVPEGATMAQMALRWVLDHPAVSTVIPGARTPEQARANGAASDVAPLSESTHAAGPRDLPQPHRPAGRPALVTATCEHTVGRALGRPAHSPAPARRTPASWTRCSGSSRT